MAKRHPPSGKPYIDKNKVRAKREAENEIPLLVQYADESDIVEKAKTWNQDITVEELQEVIRLFRAAKSERARGR